MLQSPPVFARLFAHSQMGGRANPLGQGGSEQRYVISSSGGHGARYYLHSLSSSFPAEILQLLLFDLVVITALGR